MDRDENVQSTGRYQLAAAPGGLCFVQDLLNSASLPGVASPDLLANCTTAQSWVDKALQTWGEQTGQPAPDVAISAIDLAALRELRRLVRGRLANRGEDETTHALHADVSFRDGHVTYTPSGNGAVAIASLAHLEMLLASHTGTLRRLKTCMNPACGAAFYDQSRNGTRVWHDMKICGNPINLRASRARRRESAAAD